MERTPEEEKLHRDVFLPSVDNMKLPEREHGDPGKRPLVRGHSAGAGQGTSPTAHGAVSFVLPWRDMEHWHLLSLVFRLQMSRRRRLCFWIRASGKGESEFCLSEWALEPGGFSLLVVYPNG